MIEFHYETDFILKNETVFSDWLNRVVESEGSQANQLNYVFCNDEYLFQINLNYLKHDNYTDIISFDYSEGNLVSGDIFISIDRVKENAGKFNNSIEEELLRVMSHGILHLLGYRDKSKGDIAVMRAKENEKIKMFHVEQ